MELWARYHDLNEKKKKKTKKLNMKPHLDGTSVQVPAKMVLCTALLFSWDYDENARIRRKTDLSLGPHQFSAIEII
jgi:hypothetical protein